MKMKNKDKIKISYEPEADVLTWEISGKPIDSAKEVGNIVVHFNRNHVPVLIEILEASKFLMATKNLIKGNGRISLRKSVLTTR